MNYRNCFWRYIMNDRDCQYFVNLYQTNNITRSAQQNFITQSSMTKVIQRLENEFGCQLLIRSQKGVVFTQYGEQLVQYCEKILQMRQEFKEKVNKDNGIIGGSITIGTSNNYCRYRLPSALKSFTTNYPAVNINIITGHSRYLYNQLLENRISVAIIRGEFKWVENIIHLSSEPVCLIYHKNIKISDLASKLYICHYTDRTEQYEMNRWTIENNIDTSKTSIWIDDINSCMEMAQAEVGWSIVPAICLGKFNGMIRPLFFKDGTPLIRNTYIIYNKMQQKLPQVQRFIDTLIESEKYYSYINSMLLHKHSHP